MYNQNAELGVDWIHREKCSQIQKSSLKEKIFCGRRFIGRSPRRSSSSCYSWRSRAICMSLSGRSGTWCRSSWRENLPRRFRWRRSEISRRSSTSASIHCLCSWFRPRCCCCSRSCCCSSFRHWWWIGDCSCGFLSSPGRSARALTSASCSRRHRQEAVSDLGTNQRKPGDENWFKILRTPKSF